MSRNEKQQIKCDSQESVKSEHRKQFNYHYLKIHIKTIKHKLSLLGKNTKKQSTGPEC